MKKLLTVAIVLALLSVSIAIAGNAYGKIKNDESSKACTGKEIGAEEIGTEGLGQSVIDCLQSYGIPIHGEECLASADGCCNLLVESDPDCGTGEEVCDNGEDDDGDGYVDEYCTPAGGSCTASWQCNVGLSCSAETDKCI